MHCLYCGAPIVESKGLTDAEFCSNDHRFRYDAASRLGWHNCLFHLETPTVSEGQAVLPATTGYVLKPYLVRPNSRSSKPVTLQHANVLQSLTNAWPRDPKPPAQNQGPVHSSITPKTKPRLPVTKLQPKGSVGTKARRHWQWPPAIWQRIPNAVKLTVLLAPLLYMVVTHGWIPKNLLAKAGEGAHKTMSSPWSAIGQRIQQRAAIEFADDFRTGLSDWRSRSNSMSGWAFDAAGFVLPGPLAIYRPTVELTDYKLEFLAEIDQRAMGFVFRAPDLNNYYAVKFVITEPGPLPVVQEVRYAVIQGREGPRVTRPLPVTARKDMSYRVRVDVSGHDFTLMVQDRIADHWSDSRLAQGGVGFFCGKGERMHLRWVEVSHQYDALGKLCAFLAPGAK